MGKFQLPHLNMHTWVVSATSVVGHVGQEAAGKLPPKGAPKSGSEQESAVADHHKQREATLASRSDVIARLGTLAVEPTFLARVHEATW